jgi:D-sedoheptulose 7-phosphate isomerase
MSDFGAFADSYRRMLQTALDSWDFEGLGRLAEVLRAARKRGSTILIAGNGGSAAIANHAEYDCTAHQDENALNARSLSSNSTVLTALANDLGYQSVFERQVSRIGREGDVLVLISSKGNSPNVVDACRAAKARGLVTVAFVGFDGGALKGMADHVVHIPLHNYGVVEDMHQACFHVVAQYLRAVDES